MHNNFDTLVLPEGNSPQLEQLEELIDLHPGSGEALITAFNLGAESVPDQ